MSKNCALILAAGKGKRMGINRNKIFLNLNDRPILYHTINAFNSHNDIDFIVVVASKDEVIECRQIVETYNLKKVIRVVEGGLERQDSVFNGLKALHDIADIVLIHDGARPFVSDNIISNGIKYANIYGASSCGVKPKDTIKIRNSENFSIDTLDREMIMNIQTPQCFKYNIIFSCHKKIRDMKVKVTDDTSVTEYYGYKTFLYDGEYKNIKITTYDDLAVAKNIIKSL